ncbi:sigma-54-dependent transcriptional regulator [Thalassotalea fusca]
MKAKILVIDDNHDVAHALSVLFKLNDIACDHQDTPDGGLAALASQQYDLVIQDMNFTKDTTSGEEGVTLFNQIRTQHPDLPIVLITAWTHLETAVELVKSGASDYMSKPWDDDKLLTTVNNLIELSELQQAQSSVANAHHAKITELSNSFNLCGTRFQSDAMLNLIQITTQVAQADIAVLITGPNGAGKEKIAEILQANSQSAEGPFVKVNVGAVPQDLMAAELFGAEAGAYTGINQRRIGRFELANNGTLFLDEIGNLSLDGQAKLLRVLETGEFERLGGTETIKVKVRIISATNADLKAAIANGTFREDLYYRLNVIELKLPSLYDRKADILPLAKFFLGDGYQLTERANRTLKQHKWPGNIRELKNVMQRAALLSLDKVIDAPALGLDIVLPEETAASEEVTAERIISAIQQSSGVISEAAKTLGLSRSALYRRMRKFEIET